MVFPTVKLIKKETGFDIYFETDDIDKANGIIKSMTKLAYRVMLKEKILETQTILKKLILTDEKYRNAFLDFVVSIIEDVYTRGTFEFLDSDEEIITPKSRSYLEQGLLSVGRFGRGR